MNSRKHVVHLTRSPLAGAPSRLVAALNLSTNYSAVLLRHGRISDQQRRHEPNAVAFDGPGTPAWDFCVEQLRAASIVHIHNQLSIEGLRLLASADPDVPVVFHVHSPPSERPNFFEHSDFLGLEPSLRLVVPHFHPRCYWDYTAIPNVVFPPESGRYAIPEETPTIMFTPSHRQGGRWNSKSSRATSRAIESLRARIDVRVAVIEDQAPLELLERRTSASMSLDEVVTGSFHQVSIEALACGSIPINNADDISMATLRMAYQTDVDPPFVRCTDDRLADHVLDLVQDSRGLHDARHASFEFFSSTMNPARVLSFYLAEYDRL